MRTTFLFSKHSNDINIYPLPIVNPTSDNSTSCGTVKLSPSPFHTSIPHTDSDVLEACSANTIKNRCINSELDINFCEHQFSLLLLLLFLKTFVIHL